MKKKYEAPQVEKIVFDYSETVVASGNGQMYRLYTDKATKCNSVETDQWIYGEASLSVPTCVITQL